MKQILCTIALLALTATSEAQMMLQRSVELTGAHATSDSIAAANKQWWDNQPRWSLDLGISAGGNLYTTDYFESPYFSRYGLLVQVPLVLHYRVSPHWRLGTGLRYDLHFDPLYHAVQINTPIIYGIDFAPIPLTGNTKAYSWRNYIGIPLEATWYPWPREPRQLGITFDLYAGYSISSRIFVETTEVERTVIGPHSESINISVGNDGTADNDPTLLPWKLELGLTLSTDVLGLIHGVRFFVDLLPTYRDPLIDEPVYTAGMTIFL